MAVSVCSLCRLNLLVPTPAWRLRLVLLPHPTSFWQGFSEREVLAGVAHRIYGIYPCWCPWRGCRCSSHSSSSWHDWLGKERDPDSWQETVGAGGEEGPGTKLDNSRLDLYVLEEKTQSSRQSEHPFVVFSFLFVHSASQHSPNPCCCCVPLKHLCCWFFL